MLNLHFDLEFLEETCLVVLIGTQQSSHTQHIFLSRFTRQEYSIVNLVRHNNRSFRANKLVIVSPNNKQENE